MNMTQFSKAELVKMAATKCEHGHTYLEHPNCYLRDKQSKLKIGYLDIEAGGLNANFDYMLTWVIKTKGVPEYKYGVIEQKDILAFDFDKQILQQLIAALQEYDLIYTYYGTGYDIPFIRTRALMSGIRFLSFGAMKHKDMYYIVRSKMKLHKSSLDSACAALGIKGKNHIKGNLWMRAKVGDKQSLAYVLDHNKKDCDILEKLHNKLQYYYKDTTSSI